MTARRLLVVLVALAAFLVLGLAWMTTSRGDALSAGRMDAETIDHASPAVPAELELTPGARGGAEPSSARTALSGESGVRVRVVYADGTPAARARLVLHDARTALAEARTDEDGRATLRCASGAYERELWIAVAHAGFGVHDEPLAQDAQHAAETSIELPDSGRIAGSVTVDGRAPASDLELALYGDPHGRPATLPELVWSELSGGTAENPGPWQVVRVRAGGGAFVFRGIPEDALAMLVPPPDHRVSTQRGLHGSLTVPGPVEDLALELAPFVAVRGRVVEPDGAPSAGARVRFDVASDTNSAGRAEADALGRFELELPPGAWRNLEVEARSSDLRGAGALHFANELALPFPGELGDLVLAPADVYVVRVRERGGAPIDGAEVAWRFDQALTGPDGTAQVVRRHGQPLREVFVSAEGFRSATRTALGETIEVELERATTLVVTVRGAAGACPGGVGFAVELASPEPLFDERGHLDNEALVGDGERGADGLRRHWVEVGPSCEVRVVGLREGVPLVVRLVDPTGFAVAETRVAESTASMQLELVAERAERTLHGRVLGPAGEPLPGADVIAEQRGHVEGHAWSAGVTTDRHGRFRIATCAPNVSLAVRAWRCKELRLHSVDPDASPLELRLESE